MAQGPGDMVARREPKRVVSDENFDTKKRGNVSERLQLHFLHGDIRGLLKGSLLEAPRWETAAKQ